MLQYKYTAHLLQTFANLYLIPLLHAYVYIRYTEYTLMHKYILMCKHVRVCVKVSFFGFCIIAYFTRSFYSGNLKAN